MTVASTHPEILERRRRITVDEYHRMIEAGILGEDEHVQIVGGILAARARIPEYWIVNLAESEIELLFEPDPSTGVYRSRKLVGSGEELEAGSVPGRKIDVAILSR